MAEVDNKYDSSNLSDDLDVESVLDKMLELEKEKHKWDPKKFVIYIVGAIITVMLFGVLCYRLIKTDMSFDSILSTMLAFFSIFISIFFYFKADETSSSFYKSSYNIMKDVSVALGKIEERFGEKLNSLNDKISHLDEMNSIKNIEIQKQEQGMHDMMQEALTKTQLSEKEKSTYLNKLKEYEKRIEKLKAEQDSLRRESERLKIKSIESNNAKRRVYYVSSEALLELMNDRIDFPESLKCRLIEAGYMDEHGGINKVKVSRELARRGGLV